MRIETTAAQAPARPAPRIVAAATAPAPAAAHDSLQLTRQPAVAATPIKRGPETWIGIASSGAAVGLATWGLAAVFPAVALPIVGVGLALGGAVALCGYGLTQGWGEAGKPYDRSKPDWSPMAIMTRVAGGVGLAGTLVATAIFTGQVALTAGPAAVFAWPACVLATALVGLLGWGVMKNPNPLGR